MIAAIKGDWIFVTQRLTDKVEAQLEKQRSIDINCALKTRDV
jgi:hypothetical protein